MRQFGFCILFESDTVKYYLSRAFVFPLNLKLCWNKVLICILLLSNILIPLTLLHVFISITLLSAFLEFCFFFFGVGRAVVWSPLWCSGSSLVTCRDSSCPVADGILVRQPSTEAWSAALEGGFFTTGSPGKFLD